MTALQWIIKEAKILRKKSPKMEWKKAVAQASAIYASKHKGKSPVGKKHAKKVVRKKAAKKVGVIKRKVVRKKFAKKKKPTEKAVLKSIKHAVSVQKSHMGSIQNDVLHKMAKINTELISKERGAKKWIELKKGLIQEYGLAHYKKIQKNQRHLINELKKHKSELKKLI